MCGASVTSARHVKTREYGGDSCRVLACWRRGDAETSWVMSDERLEVRGLPPCVFDENLVAACVADVRAC